MQLTEKFRPRDFGAFVGQDKAVARIRAILGLSHFDRGTFLLTGPSGSGKTSMAHVVARHLQCDPIMATMETKGADCNIDEIRRLSEWFHYGAPNGGYKIAIVNECHNMSAAAQSYALEWTENPQAKRIIVLTTTEAETWADETLASRFYTIRFAKPNADAIVEHVRTVCERESFPVPANLKRFVQDRHNNIRLILNDLEIEAAITLAA